MSVQQICTVAELAQLDPSTWWLTLEVGRLVEQHGLRAGQFLHIKCGAENFLRRPISVALSHRGEPEDTAALIFEVRGAGTRWLSQRRRGDKLDVLGPLGNGFDVSRPGRYLLAGGGIGVPPLMGYAEGLGERATAVLGYRTGSKALPPITCRFTERCENTHFCTDDGSLGQPGFVDAQVREILAKDVNFAAVLACGPLPMLRGVARAARERGVPCQVSLEERMACGVGACLGCAVKLRDARMAHVCKDGPVFDAEEVDWDV